MLWIMIVEYSALNKTFLQPDVRLVNNEEEGAERI